MNCRRIRLSVALQCNVATNWRIFQLILNPDHWGNCKIIRWKVTVTTKPRSSVINDFDKNNEMMMEYLVIMTLPIFCSCCYSLAAEYWSHWRHDCLTPIHQYWARSEFHWMVYFCMTVSWKTGVFHHNWLTFSIGHKPWCRYTTCHW